MMMILKSGSGLLLSGLLAMIFVGSLYIWKNDKERDHPETIQKRFISMAFCCIISPIHVIMFIHFQETEEVDYLTWLGLSPIGLPAAVILPLALTATLFLGPLVDIFWLDKSSHLESPLAIFTALTTDLRKMRNYVVAPFAEELVYRACILSVLVYSGWSLTLASVIAPLMFGIDRERSMRIVCFQAGYTTLFGIYASFLFLRTGHFVAPFLSHAFCNYMGLPELHRLNSSKDKNILIVAYLAGIIGFFALLMPLTNPEWYNPYIWNFVPSEN